MVLGCHQNANPSRTGQLPFMSMEEYNKTPAPVKIQQSKGKGVEQNTLSGCGFRQVCFPLVSQPHADDDTNPSLSNYTHSGAQCSGALRPTLERALKHQGELRLFQVCFPPFITAPFHVVPRIQDKVMLRRSDWRFWCNPNLTK